MKKKRRKKAKAAARKRKLTKAELTKIRLANLAKARLARGKRGKAAPKAAGAKAALPKARKKSKKPTAVLKLPRPVRPPAASGPGRASSLPAGCERCPTCGSDRRFFSVRAA